MSNAQAAQNRYVADLREIRFLLFEQFQLDEVLGQPPFDNWGKDEVSMVIDEAYKFACEVLGPLNAIGDREGCRFEDGKVITPTGFKEAWGRLTEAGWNALVVPTEHGGQGAPFTLFAVMQELMSGANTAFFMYPGLALGVVEVIEKYATHEQQQRFLPPLIEGKWAGTMCLTEAQAGSDVGAARTTAKKLPDGRYAIQGTKIFISGGDQDITENILHLVLARVEGAPPGTKGLSLFIVPKLTVGEGGTSGGSNDVLVGSIEHKMGILGSSTCVLNFGENGGCIGELVGGTENVGMSQMFAMMNGARIAVGLQSVAVASSAYLSALAYTKDRKQGAPIDRWKDATAPRVSIIEHPDVRRMLIDMKARVEGVRCLIVKLTRHLDAVRSLAGKDDEAVAYHQGQVDLLVPLVKSYGSDQSFRICETAMQTYGGAGYTRDYPVEQCARDAKIFSIYEGTNHIQAMDLVGRKLMQNGGGNAQAFLGDVAKFVEANAAHPALADAIGELGQAQEALAGTAMKLLGWFQSGRMALVPLVANRFLQMMSETAVGWLLLDGARIALDAQAKLPAGHKDIAFYEGKKQAALYFARNILPGVRDTANILAREDNSPMDIPSEAFASLD